VRVGGKPIVRVGDPCTMNGGNTRGIYVYAPPPAAGAPGSAGAQAPLAMPQTPEELAFLRQAHAAAQVAARHYLDHMSQALHAFSGDAMDVGGTLAAAGGATAAAGGLVAATGVGAVPGAALAAGGGIAATVGGGVGAVGGVAEAAADGLDATARYLAEGRLPNLVALGTAYAQHVALRKIEGLTKIIAAGRKAPAKADAATPKEKSDGGRRGGGGGFTVLGAADDDCTVKPYKDLRCKGDQHAHHIVPDYALRYGTRKDAAKRIPGMPALDDGPAICLTSKNPDGASEHNAVHTATDPLIRQQGNRTDNGPPGTAPIGDIIQIAVEEVGKIKPHCAERVRSAVDRAFKDVDRTQYGRTTQRPPHAGSQAREALARGERGGRERYRRR